uniref:Transmembrane protein n=1 Tax=Toxocara canis TaxID=6265 RepID=A0A183V6L8_TOXCA
LLTSTLHELIEDGYSVDEMHPRLDSYERLYHSASLGPIPPKSTIGPMIGIVRKQIDGVEVERPLRLTNKKLTTPFMVRFPWLQPEANQQTKLVETTTELSEEMIQKRRENFIAQLATFSDSALCIARTLLDLWCVAECAAAVPFVIGIWCPTRCLFAAHIILDTLFLVIAFIYSITLAVYSVILYMLVDDMSIWTLLRWLGFAAAVNSVLAIYVVIFIITLRCCELVVDNGEGLKRRQRFTSHYSYQEVRTLDVNDGNAV